MALESHRDLVVWQKSMDAVEATYKLTGGFPPAERFGLTAQIRRAAVSIPANLAEGYGRGSRRDYAHFVAIAKGSTLETSTLVDISIRLGICSQEAASALRALLFEIEKILTRLHVRLSDSSR